MYYCILYHHDRHQWPVLMSLPLYFLFYTGLLLSMRLFLLPFLFLFLFSFQPALADRMLNWCAGTKQYDNEATTVIWESFGDVSRVNYVVCSHRNRDISSLQAARLRSPSLFVDTMFDLCASRMECVQKSQVRSQVNGLFCVSGEKVIDIPLSSSQDYSLSVSDVTGKELVRFC
jgi:hypothetical protein